MDPKNKFSLLRTLAVSFIALGCAGGLIWSGSATRHALAGSGNKSASKPHKATLRVSDSPEGSRVVLTADQSLNSYEAYRRGDRYYVRIPLTGVPHADTIRGRAFSEVRIEQSVGVTIISFRLPSDATARVDQRGNKLEIVFLVSRTRLARSATANRAAVKSSARPATRNDRNQSPKAGIAAKANKPTFAKTARATSAKTAGDRASAERQSGQTRLSAPARTTKAQDQEAASVKPELEITPEKPPVALQTAGNVKTNFAGVSASPRENHWFPTQVNRLTIGFGAGLLLSLFGLIFLNRRRTKVEPISTETMQQDATEVETVVPEVTATARLSASEALQAAPVEENDAPEPTIGSAIGKLILDNTHRADVMNSRAPEDRKAIESSLLNIISDAETSDDASRRAREALEQYGFVAQHNATLLKGRDGWERSTAARTLGTIGSKSSLPFLIEALNDSDSIVRNEAVAAIAALKDPTAIGALVEASRKHPDLAGSLLSQTLNACSVDSVAWTESFPEVTATSPADVSATDDAGSAELPPDDISDDILSGWLALVDNPNEGSNTQDVTDVYVLPPLELPAYERRYLRVVA